MKNKTSIISKVVGGGLKQAALTLVGAMIVVAGLSTEAKAVRLRNAGTGLCLAGYNGGGNQNPYMYSCEANPNDVYLQWDRIDRRSSGGLDTYLLRNRGTGLCLDSYGYYAQGSGARPYFYPCQTDNRYHRWFVYTSQSAPQNIQIIDRIFGGYASLDGYNGGGNAFPYLFPTNFNNIYQRWYFE